jgi:hypothetical protein
VPRGDGGEDLLRDLFRDADLRAARRAEAQANWPVSVFGKISDTEERPEAHDDQPAPPR